MCDTYGQKHASAGLHFIRNISLLLICLLTIVPVHSKSSTHIWFVQAGTKGDGKSIESPIGSTIELERLSLPGDTIFLLPSSAALKGGLTLKSGQHVIGLTMNGQKPVIKNTNSTRNLGVGLILANNTRISNLAIEDTFASGVYGLNVSSIRIDGVDVRGANRSQSFLNTQYPTLPGSLPHGGMVFVHSESTAEIVVTSSSITDAAGFGIVSITSNTAQSQLNVSYTQVEGGSKIGFFDAGITALAQGSTAQAKLQVLDSQIWGRLSRSGRNIMLVASSGAKIASQVSRSYSGATGQDGIVAAVMQSPSEINLHIADSLIEEAGQMNVEGSLINLDPLEPSLANKGRVSIEIKDSIIRNAGAVSGFEHVAANVWIGGSQFSEDRPLAIGAYKVRITDSHIEGAGRVGLEFGNQSVLAKGQAEKSEYDVVLRGNSITNNGDAEVMIYAPKARIDARKNCWGQTEGLAEHRIAIRTPVKMSQLDTTAPISCDLKAPQLN